MKPHPNSPILAVIATVLVLDSAVAQSVDGIDASATPAEVQPAIVTPAPAAETAEAPILPSRMVGEVDQALYIKHLSAKLAMRSRATDPFGRFQDPDYVPPRPRQIESPNPTQKFQIEPPTPFADIVAAIEVNLVMPDKGQFLIAERSFKVGDVLPLQLPSGKVVKVQILSVSATQIDFKNVATGETAPRKLAMLPAGMQRGTNGITAPGVQPSGEEAPVPIEPVTPLSSH